jgi:hypothetical protein
MERIFRIREPATDRFIEAVFPRAVLIKNQIRPVVVVNRARYRHSA